MPSVCFALPLAVWPAAAVAGSPSLPLVFTPNRGQAQRDAWYVGNTARLNLLFARRETVLDMHGATLRIQYQYLDATGPRQIEPAGSASGIANFLIGPEEEWMTGVPLLDAVAYREIYPGIDAIYRGSHVHEARIYRLR